MLSKEEIETYKEECRSYIKFMDTAGDNAGWARGLMWYIEELEVRVKELGKGQHSLIQSRKKWKYRYYKSKKTDWEELSEECSNAVKGANLTKEDTDRIIKETREMQCKAKKYDELIEKLEKDVVNITKTMQDVKHCDDYSRNRLQAYRTKTKEILAILKGEKEV